MVEYHVFGRREDRVFKAPVESEDPLEAQATLLEQMTGIERQKDERPEEMIRRVETVDDHDFVIDRAERSYLCGFPQ